MLDAGNPDQSKAKKAKAQSKPSQRFWPFNSNNSDSSTRSEESLPITETVISDNGQTVLLPAGTCEYTLYHTIPTQTLGKEAFENTFGIEENAGIFSIFF